MSSGTCKGVVGGKKRSFSPLRECFHQFADLVNLFLSSFSLLKSLLAKSEICWIFARRFEHFYFFFQIFDQVCQSRFSIGKLDVFSWKNSGYFSPCPQVRHFGTSLSSLHILFILEDKPLLTTVFILLGWSDLVWKYSSPSIEHPTCFIIFWWSIQSKWGLLCCLETLCLMGIFPFFFDVKKWVVFLLIEVRVVS